MFGFSDCIVALIGACITVSIFQRTGHNSTASAAVFFLFLYIAWSVTIRSFCQVILELTRDSFSVSVDAKYIYLRLGNLPHARTSQKPFNFGQRSLHRDNHLPSSCTNCFSPDRMGELHGLHLHHFRVAPCHILLVSRDHMNVSGGHQQYLWWRWYQ